MLIAIVFLSALAIAGVFSVIEKIMFSLCCPDEIVISGTVAADEAEQLIRSLNHHFPAAKIRLCADGEAAAVAERLGCIVSPPA